jgi:PelA/Pel-15E family pectate lyase
MKIKAITFLSFVSVILFSAFMQPSAKITVYTIGDSTMANKDTTNGNPERGWAQVLQKFFDADRVLVENHAVNGRSSKSFFDEGRWTPIVNKLKPGDYVFIQFGHNDEKNKDPKRYTDPNGSYRDFLTAYVSDARAKGARPVLMTSIARRKFDGGMPVDTHGEYLTAVRELALRLNVPMIDMAERTRKTLLSIGPEDSKRMFMWLQPGQSPKYPDGLQDDTHLNELGANRIAQLAVGGMRELELPLTKYLKPGVRDLRWGSVVLNQTDDWYGTPEAITIADNVLLYQRNTGGWPKNIPMHQELTERDRQIIRADKDKTDDSTLDNGATYLEMLYLAKVYNKTYTAKYKDAFLKALRYMIAAQYPNGGWPQYYPLRKGYHTHITYNDNLMVNAMRILKGIAERDKLFTFVDDSALIKQCIEAFDRGVSCIIKTQYRQNDRLTAWCAQHDENTLAPAKARTYELPSLSGSESADIVMLLMEIRKPNPEIKKAIAAAVEWFEKVKITGIKLGTQTDSEGRRDRCAVSDPSAPAIWARFYELDNNRPFFCDRDGIRKYALSEIGYERRNGYGWYTYGPQEVIDQYKEYLKKH